MTMRSGLCVLAPGAPDALPRWWRLDDGVVVERGQGAWPETDAAGTALLLPPALVTLHVADLPTDMPPEQARGAARLLAAEASVGGAEAMHGAGAGSPETGYRGYAIAVADMARLLGWARAQGVDPDIVMPLAELIDEPEDSFALLDLGEGERFVRGSGLCFAADEGFAEALTNGHALLPVSFATFETSLAAALADPPCNLRSGRFAPARRWHVPRARLVRLAIGVGLLALVTLLISLVTLARLHAGAARLEEESLAMAEPLVGGQPDGASARAALDRQLARTGQGGALSGLLASLVGAMRATPEAALVELTRGSDGVTRLRLTAAGADPLDGIAQALRASGYDVSATAFTPAAGGSGLELAVRP